METKLNLPSYSLKVTKDGDKKYIYDEIRQKNIPLTPEEWVRQHIIWFLVAEKSYPSALFVLEMAIKIPKMDHKRCDILIYNRDGKPAMLVECKAPTVKISQVVFDQAILYNQQVNAKWILVTNGMQHFCCHLNKKEETWEFITEIPHFSKL